MPLIDAHAVKNDATGQTVTDYGPPGGPKGRIRRACENDRKIAEGAWATALDLSRITFWCPLLMKYCRNHSLHSKLEVGTGEHEETGGPGGFLLL